MTLSLCMIVKDEAAHLNRCLQSVATLVDEIIVADTGSTDDTVAIATSLGAQVFSLPWQNDFAAARNATLERATGEWILVLDADETLTAAGQALVKQVRAGGELEQVPLAQVLAITLMRYEVGADQAPYTAVSRLFRRRPDLRFNRPYHETVDDGVAMVLAQEPQWQVVTVPTVALTHTGYQGEAIAQRQKFERAGTIMTAYLADHPDDAYIANKLGALYGQGGNWPQARPLLERALRSEPSDPATVYELHFHLGLADSAGRRWTEAEAHYRLALAQPIPELLKLGAYINLGSVLVNQNQAQAAVTVFEQATTLAPELAVAHYNLGLAQRQRGYLDPAIAAYQRAITLEPDYAEAHQNLGVALFKLGKLPESLLSFQRAIALYQATDPGQALKLRQGLRNLGFVEGKPGH